MAKKQIQTRLKSQRKRRCKSGADESHAGTRASGKKLRRKQVGEDAVHVQKPL